MPKLKIPQHELQKWDGSLEEQILKKHYSGFSKSAPDSHVQIYLAMQEYAEVKVGHSIGNFEDEQRNKIDADI